MYHHSRYSGIGQVIAPEPGILALFTDAVGEYVASQAQTAARVGGAGAKSSTSPLHSASAGSTLCNRKSSQQRTATGRETDSADAYLKSSSASPLNNPDTSIRCDVELARIAVGLRRSAELRVWLLIQEHTRETGFHYINRADLMTLLERYGIQYTRHNLNRWLRQGQGTFWRLTTYGRVYLVSYENVAVELVQKAHEFKLYDLVSTNTPGQSKTMYINVASNTLLQFEAHCYEAWHASRNNPTISRFILKRLWNRDERSLRRLEQLAGMTVIRNTVETDDPSKLPFTAYGNLRGDVKPIAKVRGRTVYQFNLPNTYHAGIVRQHHRRGASRRVAGLIHRLLQSEALAGITEQGANAPGELCHTGRLYCETDKHAKRTRRRGNEHVLYLPDKPGEGRGVVWCIYSVR